MKSDILQPVNVWESLLAKNLYYLERTYSNIQQASIPFRKSLVQSRISLVIYSMNAFLGYKAVFGMYFLLEIFKCASLGFRTFLPGPGLYKFWAGLYKFWAAPGLFTTVLGLALIY